MRKTKSEVITELNLQPLPDEGGYFRQMHKSKDQVPVSVEKYGDANRSASTTIYYLMGRDDFSALHRLKSEEHWSYLGGVSLNLRIIHIDGQYQDVLIGPLEEATAQQLFTVPADAWFCASINAKGKENFSLVSCVVSPGFEFSDFELGDRAKLISQFPQHQALIEKYTRASDLPDQKKTSELAGAVFSSGNSGACDSTDHAKKLDF